ncbi:MAG: TetR/AcrR family transcriptional regulator [Nocardioides sp.]
MTRDPSDPSDRSRTSDPTRLRARGPGGIEQAAIEAARELLAAEGVKGLTIEAVAARTGIAKTTLYRRWRSKKDLALAVVLNMAHAAIAAPPEADAREGLTGYLAAATEILQTTLMGRVMQGLASDLATDPELAAAFHAEVVALRRSHLEELVARGVATGQVRPDVDINLLQELLFGPVYYRLLFSGTALTDDLAGRIVDAVLPAILAAPTTKA